MDGLFHGKPMNKWMIWGAHQYFWKHPYSCVFAGVHAIHHLHLPASKKMEEAWQESPLSKEITEISCWVETILSIICCCHKKKPWVNHLQRGQKSPVTRVFQAIYRGPVRIPFAV